MPSGPLVIPYEFIEHTADIGVRVRGATVPELFRHAAQALEAVLGKLEGGDAVRPKLLTLRAESVADLLHDWLAELIFEVESHQVLYDEFEFLTLEPPILTAILHGRVIDFARSQVRQEIKAVTYHQLRVTQLPDTTWSATIIFDV